MITTRARPGRPGREAGPDEPGREAGPDEPGREAGPDKPGREADPDKPGVSVIVLDLLEQPGEVVGRETGGRALEPFHGPGPEVEVDGARGVLDRAPQRPPVHADQAEQPGPGDPAPPRLAVVGRDQLGQSVGGQMRLGADVAEDRKSV